MLSVPASSEARRAGFASAAATTWKIGRSLSPINADYQSPLKYPGRILSAVIELPTGPRGREIDAQVRAAMTHQ
jgi:hypothetical protein